MNKKFFSFICGFLIYAATMTVQAQVLDANSRYYHELHIDLQNGKYGVLFRSELIVPYEYDTIIAQQDNRGFITQQSGKYGIRTVFLNYGDNTVEMGQSSRQRQYFFEMEGSGRKSKGINLSVMDISCEYDEIKFINGRYWVSKGDLKGVFNSAGGTIIQCNYDEINFTEGRYWVSKGDLKGVFNSAGGTIIQCNYDDIKFTGGRYWVSKGDLKGVFNSAGGTIMRCEFDKIELTSDGKYVAYKNGEKSLYNSVGGHLNTDFNVVYSTD